MMKKIAIYIFIWIGMFSPLTVHSILAASTQYRDSLRQSMVREGALQLSCHFTYPQGSQEIRKDMGNNAHELEKLDAFVRYIMGDEAAYIHRLRLVGYCSVEGNYDVNAKLARARVECFYNFLYLHYPVLYRYPVSYSWVAEDWEGLSALVAASNLVNRNEILRIIRDVDIYKGREMMLMKLNGGTSYKRMLKEFFPQLRRVEIIVEYDVKRMLADNYQNRPETKQVPENKEIVYAEVQSDLHKEVKEEKVDEIAQVTYVEKQSPGQAVVIFNSSRTGPGKSEIARGFYSDSVLMARWAEAERIAHYETKIRRCFTRGYPLLAIKTNLLSWAGITYEAKHTTFTPNLALEYFFSPSWAVEVGGSYAYWHYDNDRKFWGVSGYRLEPRYWINLPGMKPIAYVGIYARVGDYDIRKPEDKSDDESTNYTARYWDAGLSGGLYLQLTPWMGLELGARAGYVHSKTALYNIHPSYAHLDKYDPYRKFRVTDLLVNLVFRIQK